MTNLSLRIITALFLIPLVICLIIAGSIFLKIALIIIAFLVSKEIHDIVFEKNKKYLLYLFLFLFYFISLNQAESWLMVFGCLFIIQINILFSKNYSLEYIQKISNYTFFSLYAFIGISSILWLHSVSAKEYSQLGVGLTFIVLISTWLNDSFAYFTGRIFGKTPLFLSVSQKKTWEGFFGGAIFSVLGVIALFFVINNYFSYALFNLQLKDVLWISVPCAILAPIGDLIESKFKRLYNVKDSSGILPGHGGVFDRIDSLLVVFPWACIYAFMIR